MDFKNWSGIKKIRWLQRKGVDNYWLIHLKWFHHRFQSTMDTFYYTDGSTTPTYNFVFRPWTMKFEDVKIVIVNDYTHANPAYNHGLAISAASPDKLPESTSRFFAEYSRDLGFTKPTHGSLLHWHDNKGVMLLNLALTNGGRGDPLDHSMLKQGWEYLIYDTVRRLSRSKETRVVFILLGTTTWFLRAAINQDKHLVLCVNSPYNQFNGKVPFVRSKVLSKALRFLDLPNDYLKLPSSKRNR